MRIISGKYGRRRIQARLPEGVRPTTDIVKESLFNVLNNLIDFEGIQVLDLFAGSGSLGFEALSRGAEHIVFVDQGRKQIKYIEDAADALGVPNGDYSTMQFEFKSFFRVFKKMEPELKFDLIFADPPYALTIYDDILALIEINELASPESIIVLESDSALNIVPPKSFNIIDRRLFGGTAITILQYQSS